MIPKAILSFFLVPTACTLPHLPMLNIALIVIGAVLLLLGIVVTIILTMIAVYCSELCQLHVYCRSGIFHVMKFLCLKCDLGYP